jgi:hypothetical protein
MAYIRKFSSLGFTDSESLNSLYRNSGINYHKFFKMDLLCKSGFLCAENLAECFPENRDRTAVVFMNNYASDCADRDFEETIKDSENCFPSPSLFVYTLPNIVTGELCIRHGFKGESGFFVFEKFQAENFVNTAGDILNFHDYVLAGWSERIGMRFKTLMFWIEKTASETAQHFDIETVEKIYKSC